MVVITIQLLQTTWSNVISTMLIPYFSTWSILDIPISLNSFHKTSILSQMRAQKLLVFIPANRSFRTEPIAIIFKYSPTISLIKSKVLPQVRLRLTRSICSIKWNSFLRSYGWWIPTTMSNFCQTKGNYASNRIVVGNAIQPIRVHIEKKTIHYQLNIKSEIE